MVKILGFVVACVLASASTSQRRWLASGVWVVSQLYESRVHFWAAVWWWCDKWGMTASYVSSSRMTIEAEYHHAQMGGGILESGEFSWSPKALTSKQYRSKDINPNSSYTNRFNSVLLSGLWFFNADRSMDGGSFSPYIIAGGGLYDHKTVAENIVWPVKAHRCQRFG